VPDRSRYLDFEPHRILDVFAHYPGGKEKVAVRPLYSASMDRMSGTPDSKLFYTVRRLPRRRTSDERRFGTSSDYTGTDMFISFVEPSEIDGQGAAVELSTRALCSNRHLTEHLPIGAGGADFRFLDDVTLDVICIAGPTPPQEPVVSQLRSRSETAHLGVVTWRLVNMLSMNHLGLIERGSGRNAAALREVLAMFANLSDSGTERKIRGIRSVDSRSIVRRVRERRGIGAGRGVEVTVLLDEKAFEGSGVFLLGAILDRYFAEYSALNHFTETVICTTERGEIMRWPVRMGNRRAL
jgi:type VI secretion system protein ImpG